MKVKSKVNNNFIMVDSPQGKLLGKLTLDESIAVFKFTPDTLQLLNLETNNELPLTKNQTLQIL